MARVFVSYAREDREAAAVLAHALQAARHEVWWDRALVAGQDYTAVIEQQLSDADAVVVLWSTVSVKSKFVRDEANHALQSGRLTPVRIEPVALPLGFASLHSADVFSQDEDGHTVLEPAVLVDEVARRLDAAAGSPKAAPSFSPKPMQRPAPRRAGLPWLWAGGAAVLAAAGTAVTMVTLSRPDQPEQPVVRAAAEPAASAPAASAVAAGPAVPDAASAVSAAGATTAAVAAVAAKAAAERERKLQAQREALMKRRNDDLLRQNEQLRQDAIEKERLAKEQKAAEEANRQEQARAAAEQARRREQERQAAIEEQKRKEEAQRLADAKRREEEAKKGEPPVGSGSVTARKPIDPKVLSQIVVKPSAVTLSATQRASVINRAVLVPAASAVKP
jgi:hypothetical protein